MAILSQMQLKTVTVFRSVCTISTSVLVNVGMGFHVAVQHRLEIQ